MDEEQAWLKDVEEDEELIKAMISGNYIVVAAQSPKNTCSLDVYSLMGFTKAYNKTQTDNLIVKDQKIKQDLVDAYKICAMLKMDDLTYTHITARPQNAQYFYILAFGNMFDQASINNLIKVDIARGYFSPFFKKYSKAFSLDCCVHDFG